jgi:hypothetical protein
MKFISASRRLGDLDERPRSIHSNDITLVVLQSRAVGPSVTRVNCFKLPHRAFTDESHISKELGQ